MMKLVLFLCLPFFFSVISSAQNRELNFQVEDFYPFIIGDTMIYEVAVGKDSQMIIAFPEEVVVAGQELIKMTGGFAGNFQLQKIEPESGVFAHQVHLGNNRVLVYNEPLQILPARLETGNNYQFKAKFRVFNKGTPVDSGEHTIDIEVLGTDAAMTTLQNFATCLVLTANTKQTFRSGMTIRSTTKQWHVKGIGLVKMAGKTQAKGYPLERLIFDIKKAKIRGEWVN